jgi:hypothetical protein
MLIQTLPDLFCTVGGFVPLLEEVCEGGKVKIINKHTFILLYPADGNQFMKVFVYKVAIYRKTLKVKVV